eukprot:CAMPEP_0117466088 /NCGR_PEP_ID=MMETSP0784-20121206/4962_1 /TAXON_ID=39447 /ORGANISM="" /LENGTH=971 /DNA_ID=CAMNT_0005260019 /DNA_START=1 /DNA_END=2912 /DNA_ORIENTATION=+
MPDVNATSKQQNGAHGSCGYCLCGSFSRLRALFRSPDYARERENFERTVAFLASVPLFKKQLPKAELPKVARDLTVLTWQPRAKLATQFEIGGCFHLIQSGEALVVAKNDAGEEHVLATLYAGDYFGAHSLTESRPNPATIIAKGPEPLVTLMMSAAVFKSSGLKAKLRFPKRSALYFDVPTETSGPEKRASKSPQEEAFIREAVGRNVNLRALLEGRADALEQIAKVAHKREVSKDAVVAKSGHLGQEFFIISQGSIDVVVNKDGSDGQKSAETALARLTMAERLRRKQDFLTGLYKPIPGLELLRYKMSRSTLVNDPRSPSSGTGSPLSPGQSLSKSANFVGNMALRRLYAASGLQPGRRQAAVSECQEHPGECRMLAFDVGDRVICLGCSDSGEGLKGTVVGVGTSHQEVEIDDSASIRHFDAAMLRPALEEVAARLQPGDSFGELSLIYNTLREATFQASEDSVVYVVSRRDFKVLFNRKGTRFEEYRALLDEVPALTPLVQAERWELACNAVGIFTFEPGERVLRQGVVREAKLWYVIQSGSCVIMTESTAADGKVVEDTLVVLNRGGHFGERSLLRGDAAPEVTCAAGPNGMTCLAFSGEIIRGLLESIFRNGIEEDFLPSVTSDVGEYAKRKARNAMRSGVPDAAPLQGNMDLGQFEEVCVLGHGGFATVFLMEEPTTRSRFALKRLSKGHVESLNAVRQVCWERDLLSMVDSPFIVHLHKTFKDDEYVYLLLEAALGGNLYQLLRAHPEVLIEVDPPGSAVCFYVACITSGVEHLHDRRIVYRDLKPENVMLDLRGYAKLCDMGFARFVLGKTNTMAGTPEYMAPEMIDFPHSHDTSVDWWALGVLTFELMAGQPPWEDEGVDDQYERLLAIRRSQERGDMRFPYSCPSLARSFILQLLKKLPARLGATGGASAVKEHAWFRRTNIDWEALQEGKLASPFLPKWVDPEPGRRRREGDDEWLCG